MIRETTDEHASLDIRELKRGGLIDPGQEQLEGVARLVWTSVNFGGARPWFVCPGCGCRAAILYGPGPGRMLCRLCRNLAYSSQQKGPIERARRRLVKARERLGSGSKPPGMHRKTWSRLIREYREAVEELDALQREREARLEASRLRRKRRWRRQGWE